MELIDIFGYLGMGFVVLSFMMKNIIWLRVVNIIGAILSAIYGLITKTYPTMCLNLALFLVNSYFLINYFVKKDVEK